MRRVPVVPPGTPHLPAEVGASIAGLCSACVSPGIGPSKAPAFRSLHFWGEEQPFLGQRGPPSGGSFNSASAVSVLSQSVLIPRDTKTRNRLSRIINVRNQGLLNKPHSPTEMKCSGVLHGELQQGPAVPHVPQNKVLVSGKLPFYLLF